MAQFNWTYLGDGGQRYNVGVFHGPKTGHVLVFCNLRIVLVDFSVLDTKEYSFFLGEELCQLKLDRRGDTFVYDMNVNREADTPLNRERKARDKKHWFQSIVFFSAMLFCIITFSSLVIYNQNPEEKEMERRAMLLGAKPATTIGTIVEIAPELIYYQYVVEDRIINGHMQHQMVQSTNNGMPIILGDEFVITYSSEDPRVHHFDFENPTFKQLGRYKALAFEKHAGLHPEFSDQRIACMIEIGYELFGIEAYAYFYFQGLQPKDNVVYNSLSYKRLVRDLEFKKLEGQRCL